MAPLPNTRIMRIREVVQTTGIPRSTLYAWIKANEAGFPRPIQLGPRNVGWRSDQIEAWIASRAVA